jgi:hypothetical protein
MQDGTHAEIDFDFYVNGELFLMLYYLVNGIYPSLARFLASIPDPHTKIHRYFAGEQESYRKDIERAFGVLKIKFLSINHPILLHHRDDIYYLVLACVAMHNMMVQERMDDGEMESDSIYNTITQDAVETEPFVVDAEASMQDALNESDGSYNSSCDMSHKF